MLEIHQFPCLTDNYGFLIHDPVSGETACIDTPDADAYLREAGHKGWQITQIWNTHWHPDHAGGNAAIKAATGCKVVGPAEVEKLGTAPDRTVEHGDTVMLGEWDAAVIDVGGHTMGHVAYHMPDAETAFVGDALFALGCGRMFEGTPDQFWASLVPVEGPAALQPRSIARTNIPNPTPALRRTPIQKIPCWRPIAQRLSRPVQRASRPCPLRWPANSPPTRSCGRMIQC
jgi:glyoxylase-like metal-dependent hydrolase (beta-lactamase superfamily II)